MTYSRTPWNPSPNPERTPNPDRMVWPDPTGDGVGSWLEERLYQERVVLVQGTVDAAKANRANASLLTLDAIGKEPVRLHLSATDGDMNAVFALVDAVDVMRAPVHAVAIGEVGGGPLAVYAAADRRLAYPHARFRLSEPTVPGVAGTADVVAAAAGRYLQALDDLVVRLAAATGVARSRIEDDLSASRILDATEAVEYGLVHEIVARKRT
jgi:ATP-dependent Clp protease protease subunit